MRGGTGWRISKGIRPAGPWADGTGKVFNTEGHLLTSNDWVSKWMKWVKWMRWVTWVNLGSWAHILETVKHCSYGLLDLEFEATFYSKF